MKFFAIIAFALLALMPLPAKAAVTPEKAAVIQELITLMKIDDMATEFGDQMVKTVVNDLKRRRRPVEPKMRAAIEEEARLFVKEEMTRKSWSQSLYPLYDKHFTTQELRDIVAFYKTPAGRKSLQALPVLSKEFVGAGRQWGLAQMASWQRRVGERIKKENAKR